MANRKLNLVLRSKYKYESPLNVVDLVQVFIKIHHEKRGKWASAELVVSYDEASSIVTVPGQNNNRIKAAVDDVSFAISDDELAVKHQEAIDELDITLDDSVNDMPYQYFELDLNESDPSDCDEIGPINSIEFGA